MSKDNDIFECENCGNEFCWDDDCAELTEDEKGKVTDLILVCAPCRRADLGAKLKKSGDSGNGMAAAIAVPCRTDGK
jgi:hypothetical protein